MSLGGGVLGSRKEVEGQRMGDFYLLFFYIKVINFYGRNIWNFHNKFVLFF